MQECISSKCRKFKLIALKYKRNTCKLKGIFWCEATLTDYFVHPSVLAIWQRIAYRTSGHLFSFFGSPLCVLCDKNIWRGKSWWRPHKKWWRAATIFGYHSTWVGNLWEGKVSRKKSVGHFIHIIGKFKKKIIAFFFSLRKMKLIVVFFLMQPPREESNQKF